MKRLLLCSLFLVISCQEKTSSSSSTVDPLAEAIEGAVNSVAGASDDASNESVVALAPNPILELLVPSAHAAACTRTLSGAGGVCSRNVNCERGPFTWTGLVTLTFANGASCAFSGTGDSFVRTVNFTRSGPRGSLRTTSDSRLNYLGQPVGGGVQVEKTASGYELSVLGQSKILTGSRGRTIFDVSTETSAPLVMNQLARSGRIVDSGTIEVHHNRAQFTATHSLNQLQWTAGCCYPVGGSIDVTLSGSRTGSGTVTFNGCGSVTTTFATTRSFTLANCE